LPDGSFSHQKFQFVYILESLGMEDVGTFYDLLKHFTAIWYSLLSLVYFFSFEMFGP
jgi:hypothetical protein